MENNKTTFTLEVDTEGGWLVKHWTQTWDTRVALTSIADQEAEAQKAVDEAQANLTKIQESKAAFQVEIDAAVASAQAAAAKVAEESLGTQPIQ